MKYLLILLSVLVLGSCEDDKPIPTTKTVSIGSRNLNQYDIDGCEYIGQVYGGYGDFLTHKGNCHNPSHVLIDTSYYYIVDKTTGTVMNAPIIHLK